VKRAGETHVILKHPTLEKRRECVIVEGPRETAIEDFIYTWRGHAAKVFPGSNSETPLQIIIASSNIVFPNNQSPNCYPYKILSEYDGMRLNFGCADTLKNM
jgi:hypothetical protein